MLALKIPAGTMVLAANLSAIVSVCEVDLEEQRLLSSCQNTVVLPTPQ